VDFSDTRAIIISVDFADALNVSLPFNRNQFKSTLVVTHPNDTDTADVARQYGADVLMTKVFYEREAVFNKFAALELGLEYMGRHGWIAILDADVLFPRKLSAWTKRIGCLYTPRRRMYPTIPLSHEDVPEERKWRQYKYPYPKDLFDGYCQIFHASDPVLGRAPWHMTNWKWCSGPDFFFQQKWKERDKVRPQFDVLHLGEPRKNWAGRVTPFADGTVHQNAEKHADINRLFLRDRALNTSRPDMHETEKIL